MISQLALNFQVSCFTEKVECHDGSSSRGECKMFAYQHANGNLQTIYYLLVIKQLHGNDNNINCAINYIFNNQKCFCLTTTCSLDLTLLLCTMISTWGIFTGHNLHFFWNFPGLSILYFWISWVLLKSRSFFAEILFWWLWLIYGIKRVKCGWHWLVWIIVSRFLLRSE